MRRTGIDAEYYNEGLSYPTGWKLFLANPCTVPVRSKPPAQFAKEFPRISGLSHTSLNFRIWQRIRVVPPQENSRVSRRSAKPLVQAALMRTVRYSSDSTVKCNFAAGISDRIATCAEAAVYDYDTKDIRNSRGELIFGRLCEWLVDSVGRTARCAVSVKITPSARAGIPAGGRLAHIREYEVLPLDRLQMAIWKWVIRTSISRFGASALQSPR